MVLVLQEKNIFYQRVLELSKQKGKSLNSIERDLAFPRNSLHNYKNGNLPSGDRLLKVSHYFNVDPEYLLGESCDSDIQKTDKLFQNLGFMQKVYISKKSIDWLSDIIPSLNSKITIDAISSKDQYE